MAASPELANFVRWCKSEAVRLGERLEPLESGRMHLGRRQPGGQWEDRTPHEIALIKRNIAELHELIAQYE